MWKPSFSLSLTMHYCRQQMEFAKPIRALMFSNSNNHLALGGDEGVLYVLSVPSRSMISNTILSAPIFSIAFSKLDERLAVGSKDGVLTLICPATDWEPVGEIEQSEAAVLAQDWSSRNLAVGRDDGTIAVFENEKVYSNFFVPQAELTQKLPIRSVAFGASGRFLGE
jgi:WD40 repeat protein